jgi:hypothetical protein
MKNMSSVSLFFISEYVFRLKPRQDALWMRGRVDVASAFALSALPFRPNPSGACQTAESVCLKLF